METYSEVAKQARIKVLELIYKAQTSHVGSNFSAIDIMAVLFDKMDLDKDKFVLSKGWAAASLYYFLWKKGRITEDQLNSYCKEGSEFIGLAEPIIPEIPIAGGSMGLGLPGAVGIALAKKLKDEGGKVYVLLSDGEMQIGTTHESALIAFHHNLDNLVVIIDNNGLQAMGKVEDILDIHFTVFNGWDFLRIDGHRYESLENAFNWNGIKPFCIVADTIKGNGVSFMENNNEWHYRQIDQESYELAQKELR